METHLMVILGLALILALSAFFVLGLSIASIKELSGSLRKRFERQ